MKERLAISLENDLRKGMVRFDERYLYAKVVDLPCIMESHKTIDKKSFYKTADICQMVICKEEPDPVTDDESPVSYFTVMAKNTFYSQTNFWIFIYRSKTRRKIQIRLIKSTCIHME